MSGTWWRGLLCCCLLGLAVPAASQRSGDPVPLLADSSEQPSVLWVHLHFLSQPVTQQIGPASR